MFLSNKSLAKCHISSDKIAEERLLETEIQRVFMALDISINEDMRANPEGKLKEIITAIDNIKDQIRDKKVNCTKSAEKNPVTNGRQQQASSPIHNWQSIPPIGHIFISYSTQDTKQAMNLRDLLKEREIPVWFDEETEKGNSIEAMVLGLNDARLVIMCLSDAYRQSEFCKREAEYTVLKKKLFQPVIFQEGFRMENDWLCFVVGLQSWIDLSSDMQFKANKEMFIEQVHHMFYFGESFRFSAPVSATASSVINAKIPLQFSLVEKSFKRRSEIQLSSITSPVNGRPKSGHLGPSEFHVMNWNNDQVIKWLDAEGLTVLKEKYESRTYMYNDRRGGRHRIQVAEYAGPLI